MRNPIDALSNAAIERPKAATATILILVLGISSMTAGPLPEMLGVGIVFDNSEDAFFPDPATNEDVRILYEIEESYQSDLDLVRVLIDLEPGALETPELWAALAIGHAHMMNGTELGPYLVDPGFGSVLGPVPAAWFWSTTIDPVGDQWIEDLLVDLDLALNTSDEAFAGALGNLSIRLASLPAPSGPTSATPEALMDWTPEPGWLDRMDAGENRSALLDEALIKVALLPSNRSNATSAQTLGVVAGYSGLLGAHRALQDIPARDLILQSLPTKEADGEGGWTMIPDDRRWSRTDLVVMTMFVSSDVELWSENGGWTYDLTLDVGSLAASDAVALALRENTSSVASNISGLMTEQQVDADVRGFSFAEFDGAQTEAIGGELGRLLGASLLLLTIILFIQFGRSVIETFLVLGTTVLGILATYGMSGLLSLEFNAAMNSIPILLLAIGVDYGIHVVARYRESVREEELEDPKGRTRLKEFSEDIRIAALRKGTLLTSAALLIAIFTDVVGFASFRFSSQKFLVAFGTVIAIGLVNIYLLAVTLLPALLRILPPSGIDLSRSTSVDPDLDRTGIGNALGRITGRSGVIMAVALVLTIPMAAAITQLEVGFDIRDQLDEDLPAVGDFLVLVDRFDASEGTIYVRYIAPDDGAVISSEGRDAIRDVEALLAERENVNNVASVWSVLDGSEDPLVRGWVDGGDYASLDAWLRTNETGRSLVERYLPVSGEQTVVTFEAPTIDWQSTLEFSEGLVEDLEEAEGEATLDLSGRPLILAAITQDVARSAVLSTGIVAGIILLMLIGLQVVERGSLGRGALTGVMMWIPLAMVVAWVYGIMALLGYELNSQTVTIGALTLGLGVDYAVHWAHRYEEERAREPSAGHARWVAVTTVTTGRAMAGAAITTAGGFAVLNLSGLVPLRLFGTVFLIAISLALISSLLLLPALFALRPGEEADAVSGVAS